MYIERHLTEAFHKANRFFPAILVTGARQVGKTTFLRKLAKTGRNYVTLDDPGLRALAKEDPRSFLDRFAPPVLIDEIQYVPELLNYIKIVIDERRFHAPDSAHGMFWLTGSQPFELMKGVSESLAGRIAVFELPCIAESELGKRQNLPFTPDRPWDHEKQPGVMECFRKIWQGYYPEVLQADEMERNFFYASYVNTYLERDIRNLANVQNLERFYKFLCSCAARTGQILNFSELARDASSDIMTAKAWLSVLVSSKIAYLLPAYASSLTARLVKTPKLYFLDTGLCAYLTHWSSPETLEAGAMAGEFFETWCVSEVLKSYWNAGMDAKNLFYYRDKDQREVDLILDTPDGIFPVECKKTSTPKTDDARHFKVLHSLGKPILKGAILCTCEHVTPLPQKDVICLPATLI